ncbi:hypothetical protein Tco_1183527, partial [Tanacetum coccineum]
IKEYLVIVNNRRAFWNLIEDILKITILNTNTPYPSRRYGVSVPELTKDHEGNKPIRRIQKKAIRRIEDIVCEDSGRYQSWSLLQETPIRRIQSLGYAVNMDNPNITMEEIWCNEDVHDLKSVETEFPALVFDDAFTSEVTHSCEPTISPLNDNKIDFRISYDESDDEDYTIQKNDNDKVNMPSFSSPKPTVSYFDDLDFFKDFENEFPAIVYNDALTSKSDFLTEPTVSPQHIDEFDLKDETSLSECDEEEQNVLYFNDLFPFNVIYPDDSKLDKNNDDDKIDIKKSSGGNVINTNDGAYAQRYQYDVSWGMDTAYRIPDFVKTKSMDVGEEFTKSRDPEVLES